MAHRPAGSARPLVALALAAALLPFSLLAAVRGAAPAPPSRAPSGCCPSSAPPACPACPSEGRPSAPVAPKRAGACCSPAALLPGAASLQAQPARPRRDESSVRFRSSQAGARAAASDRRSSVAAASPPPRLLACTFRN
ncbi:MAG: hypothetical protein KBB14_19475 [Thermoanaerobaculia bacterium]|nr:hypothetical protein [Thermoanaerobaculia bacterium]